MDRFGPYQHPKYLLGAAWRSSQTSVVLSIGATDKDNVGFFYLKEHLAIWIVGAMPLGPRVKEFSGYLFVLTQLATESFGGKVVLRHSSLLPSRKNLGKWREMGGEINLRATICGTKIWKREGLYK